MDRANGFHVWFWIAGVALMGACASARKASVDPRVIDDDEPMLTCDERSSRADDRLRRAAVGCGMASRPVGEKLAVHGHGLLKRQLRGVLEVGATPGVVVLSVRRYACLACKAVMTVVPAGMLARRQYSAPSIALALHLWLLAGLSDRAVRDQVCAWHVRRRSGSGWAQLYRWARQPARVFASPRPAGALDEVYAHAKRMLTTLRSLAPVTYHAAPIALQVFEGAAHMR